MALVINNRVRELTSTTGTGAVTLGGAVGGFQTFAAGIGNDNTTYYAISINTENEWEVGLGTLNADSSTLTRTSVLESSNGDAAVDFAAGSKEVFCTLPSEKAVYLDASGDQVGGFSSLVADTSPQLGGDLDLNSKNLDFPTVTNISDCLDEDSMSSDSATKLATQQSIKAYADTKLAAVVDDTSPQLGGDLDLNSKNLDFPTVTNISDCLDEDDMSSDSATKLATQQSIKAYADSISGADITTEGEFFSNYTNITGNLTTTLTTAKNRMIIGPITVDNTYTWDIAGTGELTFL